MPSRRSSIISTPVSVMETAGEGGAWGMALLAAYRQNGAGQTLDAYLEKQVFRNMPVQTVEPDRAEMDGFDAFTKRFCQGLSIESSAVKAL